MLRKIQQWIVRRVRCVVGAAVGLLIALTSQQVVAQELTFKAEAKWGEDSRICDDVIWRWNEDVTVEITFEGISPEDAKNLHLTILENKEPLQKDRARSSPFTAGDRVHVHDPNNSGKYYLGRVSFPGGRTALFGKYPNGFVVKVRRV